jgi:hypothetical protein
MEAYKVGDTIIPIDELDKYRVYICQMCHKEMAEDDGTITVASASGKGSDGGAYDVCEECREKVLDVIKGGMEK